MRAAMPVAAVLALGLPAGSASAGGTLRIAMTASDVPTTTGAPDNGYEGVRFLGYPVFEGLALWDLRSADKLADIRPGLAERWEQDAADKTKWVFHLRKGVKFHDGSEFNANAAIWNLDRYYKKGAKQFDPPGGAVAQARNPFVAGYRKIDDYTIEITNPRPLSYFPYMLPYMLYSSPAQFEKTGSWAEFAKAPSGTGPFKITEFKPRVSVTLSRNDDYWDKTKTPKLNKMVLRRHGLPRCDRARSTASRCRRRMRCRASRAPGSRSSPAAIRTCGRGCSISPKRTRPGRTCACAAPSTTASIAMAS